MDGIISTGWESLLEAVLAANLGVVRTWPVEATSTTSLQVMARGWARLKGDKTNTLTVYLAYDDVVIHKGDQIGLASEQTVIS